MILKMETVSNNKQSWRIVQVNEVDVCGYSCEEDCSFGQKQISASESVDSLDLTDLRNPHRLCEADAAKHFLQIIADRKKVYWVNGQVFLMSDGGKTIDKLY